MPAHARARPHTYTHAITAPTHHGIASRSRMSRNGRRVSGSCASLLCDRWSNMWLLDPSLPARFSSDQSAQL